MNWTTFTYSVMIIFALGVGMQIMTHIRNQNEIRRRRLKEEEMRQLRYMNHRKNER